MSNISAKPRVGWVHPREATGPGVKEAVQMAGAGNITAEPPAAEDYPNARPTIAAEDYPTPRDSGGMADGTTGGNFKLTYPPETQVIEQGGMTEE
jgi:hypothetical protein